MPEDTIKDLALKFAEKNPSFIRDCVESHFIRFEELEISEGRIIKAKCIKNYKEVR